MKLSFPAFLLLIVVPAWAQPPQFFQPLGQVKQFLQLSDSQVQTILANNEAYNRYSSERQTRIRQVQAEIADETAKDTLDPNALGVRYAEVEAICREMKDRVNEYRTRNRDVLNPDQKTKLKILEDALKLAPVISEAQGGNLLGGFTYAPPFFTSTSGSTTSGSLIAGLIGPANGCYLPFPVVRTGDFSPASAATIVPANRVSGPGLNPAKPSGIPNRWFDTSKFVEVNH